MLIPQIKKKLHILFKQSKNQKFILQVKRKARELSAHACVSEAVETEQSKGSEGDELIKHLVNKPVNPPPSLQPFVTSLIKPFSTSQLKLQYLLVRQTPHTPHHKYYKLKHRATDCLSGFTHRGCSDCLRLYHHLNSPSSKQKSNEAERWEYQMISLPIDTMFSFFVCFFVTDDAKRLKYQ